MDPDDAHFRWDGTRWVQNVTASGHLHLTITPDTGNFNTNTLELYQSPAQVREWMGFAYEDDGPTEAEIADAIESIRKAGGDVQ